jgi:hypothetical protein
MITFTIFRVLLVLAIVLEAQGFTCTDKVFKNGVCGKGKNANKTFKRGKVNKNTYLHKMNIEEIRRSRGGRKLT